MQRNHVVIALLKRGGSTKNHRKPNKAKRKSEKQKLRQQLKTQPASVGFFMRFLNA